MVRLQSNSMASGCSPSLAPGASFCAMTAWMMRSLISDAVLGMHLHQQEACLLVCKMDAPVWRDGLVSGSAARTAGRRGSTAR